MSQTSSFEAAALPAMRTRRKGRRGPTQLGFEKLLALFGPGDAARTERYRRLRRRLVLFFQHRGCPFPEDFADEVVDRAARRLEDGVQLRSENPDVYCSGVASLVYREFLRDRRNTDRSLGVFPPQPAEAANENHRRLDCLDECLSRLCASERRLLLAYYAGDDLIEERRRMCREMSVSANTLRLRTFRLRQRVETELRARLGRPPG